MFCSSCGNQIQDGISFCKSCGMRLDNNELSLLKTKTGVIKTLTVATILVSGGGILAVATLIGKLLENGFLVRNAIFVLIGLLCVTVFGIVFLMLRQISALIQDKTPENRNLQIPAYAQPQLSPKTTNELTEFHEPIFSVTENTTRTLEEVPILRK